MGVLDKLVSACELGGYRSGVVADLKSLAKNAASLGERVQTVGKIVKLSSVLNTLSQTTVVFIGAQICIQCRKVRSVIAFFLCWRSKHSPARI